MLNRNVSAVISALALALAACSGDKPPAEPPPPPAADPVPAKPMVEKKEEPVVEKKEEPAPPPPPPKKTAKEVLEGGGTFMFSLADSADAKKMHDEECAKKAKKDEKKLEACKKDGETAAAGEGVTFAKGEKGLAFTSFGKEKDKQVDYLKGTLKVTKDDKAMVEVAPEGKFEGKQAKTAPKAMTIEVTDDNTVVLTDPKKGKLVYKKKLASSDSCSSQAKGLAPPGRGAFRFPSRHEGWPGAPALTRKPRSARSEAFVGPGRTG